MPFLPFKDDVGSVDETLESSIIANSATINRAEAVRRLGAGFANVPAAAAPIFGIVVGFTLNSGAPIPPAAFSAGTAYLSDVDQVVAAADNQTVAQRRALVNTSTRNRYSATVNGTLGTTVNSDQPGVRIDVDSAGASYGRLLETTATRTAGTAANFYSWGVDPNDTTRLVVNIAESELVSDTD